MTKKVKLALVQKDLNLQAIADEIGRSKVLVSLILSGKHKGYEHRPRIARLLGLKEKDLTPPRSA